MNNNQKQVRVRFAPSPTGEVHIGSARTALFNYLFAKHHSGKIVLRIEDTDQKRFVPGAVERLIEAMEWLGIEFDEGVELNQKSKINLSRLKGEAEAENQKHKLKTQKQFDNLTIEQFGSRGPYIQSERLGIYQEYVQKLIEDGQAYYCFCSESRLAKMREMQIKNQQLSMYDRKCLKLSGEDIDDNLKAKKPYVVRLKINPSGKTSFTDLIRGYVEFDNSTIDDQILIKSDGMPTYHLANVVDDHLMNITHVLRAEEWLPSTPKHLILYGAFRWEPPQFAHLPQVLAADRSKLSKRHGAVSVEEFIKSGYLPEAIINFIALIGWNPKDNREFFTIKELIKEFNISKINKAGGVFDRVKLDHFNQHYISEMDNKRLLKAINLQITGKYRYTDDQINKIITVIKDRMVKLCDFEELAKPFLEEIKYDPQLLIFKKSTQKLTLKGLSLIADRLSQIAESKWQSTDELNKILLKTVSDGSLTNGDIFWPIRVALSGLEKSPSPAEMLWAIGKEESLKRLGKGIKLLNNMRPLARRGVE